jgi:pyrroline-5-carboxylate reductase
VVETREADLVFPGGPEQACEAAFATPIGPTVSAVSALKQAEFRMAMTAALTELTQDVVTSGPMASNILIARKPS